MPPKKGLGGTKGKGKAPRSQPKRVRHRDDSSEEELDPQVAALLAKVQALERSRGIDPTPIAHPQPRSARPRETRNQTQANLIQSLAARIEAIEPQPARTEEQLDTSARDTIMCSAEPSFSRQQTQAPPEGTQHTTIVPALQNSGAALQRPGTMGAPAAGAHASCPVGHWQREVERAVWQSVAPSTKASYQRADCEARRSPVRVVICGHSMVFWAGRRAATSSFGSQLGFSQRANIQWLGRRGMRWERLLPTLFQDTPAAAPPQVLIIHLGGNDLGLLKGKALILQAIADFKIIRQRWPRVRIVWSCILPRFIWRSGDIKPMERARRRVNSEIFRELSRHGDLSITHPTITLTRRELYRQDGVHLSDIGNDLFLYDLQRALGVVLGSWGVSD
ncbi:uncharacterized protein LOC134392018 isoform X1 [Elgaria multicarinata webbii]|uniref:uncharacterized protein LOC134392018 isoform X1 n=1 Tax=Elgaria multicarinata webbii TaxID=159646 RepID=UPI002FCD1A61